MPRALRYLAVFVLIAIIALTSAGAGLLIGRANPGLLGPFASAQADPTLDLTLFWESWNYLRQEYYRRPLDRQALVRGAVKGMLEATGDDNTGYLERMNFQLFSTQLQGSFEGIGAEVGTRDGRVVIISPIAGSPAERAGLRPGDVILSIDGQDATALTLLEVIAKVRGTKGTSVTLTLRRVRDPTTLDEASRQRLLQTLPALEEALRASDAARARDTATPVSDALRALSGATFDFDVTIVRDSIVLPRVEERMLEERVAYLKVGQFSRGSSADFDRALASLLASSPTDIVLDLRGNSGGFVNEAVAIASQFLSEGALVFIEERSEGEGREFRAAGGGRALSLPLVVLVDKGSASASEILAGALRDNGRARLVGEQTFGKGTEQLQHELSDGSGIRITIARWLTPRGTWVHEAGLEPDVAVSDTDPAPPDVALERGLALLRD
jgi:carboxyl-terminal processing protease